MQTLSQIKDIIAQRYGYADWLQIDMTEKEESERNQEKVDMMDEIAIEYARQACEEQRELCAEKFTEIFGLSKEAHITICEAPLPELN